MTAYITQYCENNTPDEITDIRFSLVNNIIFAALSIRIGLHRCFLYTSHKLYIDIQRFFDHQNRSNHRIGPEVRFKFILCYYISYSKSEARDNQIHIIIIFNHLIRVFLTLVFKRNQISIIKKQSTFISQVQM